MCRAMCGAPEILDRLKPSDDAMLRWVAPRITDAMLRTIAEADYGYDAEKNFEALKPIRDYLEVPTPLDWNPREVLDLTRWLEPDSPECPPGQASAPGHLMRAFAAAALLRALADGDGQGDNQSIAQLVGSARVLDPEACMAARRFLAWCVKQGVQNAQERPFYFLALLLLSLQLSDLSPEDINTLASCVIEEEASIEEDARMDQARRKRKWLFGISIFNIKKDTWLRMIDELIVQRREHLPPECRDILLDIANRAGLKSA